MWNPLNVVFVSHPGNSPGFRQTTALGAIRLHDIHGMLLKKRPETLAAREDFSRGDRQWRMAAKFSETGNVIRWQCLFKPDHIVGCKHLGGPQSPLVAMRPKGIAPTSIDHQFHTWTNGIAGRLYELLIGLRV